MSQRALDRIPPVTLRDQGVAGSTGRGHAGTPRPLAGSWMRSAPSGRTSPASGSRPGRPPRSKSGSRWSRRTTPADVRRARMQRRARSWRSSSGSLTRRPDARPSLHLPRCGGAPSSLLGPITGDEEGRASRSCFTVSACILDFPWRVRVFLRLPRARADSRVVERRAGRCRALFRICSWPLAAMRDGVSAPVVLQ